MNKLREKAERLEIKIDDLKAKLDVAIQALDFIACAYPRDDQYITGPTDVAQKALTKIRGELCTS